MPIKISSPRIFTTTDCFGNLVELDHETWEGHVIDEHAIMNGYEDLVRKTIEDPDSVRVSTRFKTSVAYISAPGVGPSAEGIRVLVSHADQTFEKGSTSGIVRTAYPIEIAKYATPRLGATIYTKGGLP